MLRVPQQRISSDSNPSAKLISSLKCQAKSDLVRIFFYNELSRSHRQLVRYGRSRDSTDDTGVPHDIYDVWALMASGYQIRKLALTLTIEFMLSLLKFHSGHLDDNM